MPNTHTVALDGGTLQRGFWLYTWEVTPPDGEKLLYVGRTGDSSSPNAQSPFNRMGKHLGNLETSSMLRNHLDKRGVLPEQCKFRLVAHGPILEEADGMEAHKERRDLIGALEKKLAEDLAAAGYEVMNTVNCLKPLDEEMYAPVHAAFAQEFRGL
ncbi:MAG: hypothetical protein U0R52_07555 [Solirubrobacterales bacterium]